jgi:peptide/nickel transport system permease protein
MIGVGSSGSSRRGVVWTLGLLAADRFALASAIFLILMILAAAIGPELLVDTGTRMNLQMRNAPPFSLEHGFAYFLGGDALGRPILPRLLVAARTTLLITLAVVACSMVLGALLGLFAGYFGRRIDSLIMRVADVVMSFPSLLLAVIVLYVLEPRVGNVVIVLAITRTPVYIRVARAEVLEVRERLFIDGARAAGASDLRIMALHIAPIVLPTIFTVATLDFANVMLAESALSFLGIGVQPPGVTWGLMVATGRNYLTTAWWLAFWPGLAILLTALAANLLSNWLRIAMDPKLRWRLEQVREEKLRG